MPRAWPPHALALCWALQAASAFDVELLSAAPRAFRARGLLAPAECERLVVFGEPKVAPAQVVTAAGPGQWDSKSVRPSRTSATYFLRRGDEAELVAALDARVELLTHLPASHGGNRALFGRVYMCTRPFRPCIVLSIYMGYRAPPLQL
jgi:hypothetical protein